MVTTKLLRGGLALKQAVVFWYWANATTPSTQHNKLIISDTLIEVFERLATIATLILLAGGH